MATISFFMLSEPGHLNGSIKLAKSLEACGHRTCFLGMPDSARLIHREGLEFIPVLESLSQRPSSLGSLITCILYMIMRGEAMQIGIETLLNQAVAAVFKKEEEVPTKQELFGMIDKIRETKPDLFFADYFLLPLAFIVNRIGINSAMLNVTLFESPITFDPLIDSRIDFPSILKMPVVHLCPREFDLPDSELKGYPRYYIEPSIDLSRKQEAFEWSWIKEDRQLLLCSFGSQSRVYSRAKIVIQTVIDAMAANPKWQTVISLGDSLKAEDFSPVPANVLLSNMLPQLEILKKASIMITHGGLNSVKECIFFGVPMIVIPFDLDQPLNALRVVHHGLGLMANPETVSAAQLHSMIERIEKDHSFKNRVDLMKVRFRESEDSGVGVKTVMELLNQSNC
jgi:zeaxanthin glucosyltransferase